MEYTKDYLYDECIKKLRKLPERKEKKRIQEMKNCNHLFVLLASKDNLEFEDNFCENKVECVHCGLTNKYITLEDEFFFHYSLGYGYNNVTLETKVFNEVFEKSFDRKNRTFDDSVINLISTEELPTNHPDLLYNLAKYINPDGTNEELFSIMKKLHELETDSEKELLIDINNSHSLYNRYLNVYEPRRVRRIS